VLEIKAKINSFFKHHPSEKKIPTELLNEAFRWRLS
jgi:adenylate kinase